MIGTLDKNHKVEIPQKVTIVRLNGYTCTYVHDFIESHAHKIGIPRLPPINHLKMFVS